MADEQLTSESPNLRGRWICYVHTDPNTGRDRVAVTQVVSVEVKYARPTSHKELDTSDKVYVEWLKNQDGGGKIQQVNVMTLSPEQVINNEEPIALVTVEYGALGSPMKIVEFLPASVGEVLAEINHLASRNPDKVSALTTHYGLVSRDEFLIFPRKE